MWFCGSYRYIDDSGSGKERSYTFGDLRYDVQSGYLEDPRQSQPELVPKAAADEAEHGEEKAKAEEVAAAAMDI